MNPHDRVRLEHILDALRTAVEFASNRERADIESDRMLAFALVRALEIAGEAASKTDEETRTAYPELPWRAMIGMRNRLIHGYFDIDHDIVWNTAKDIAPEVIRQIEAILSVT